MTERPLECSQCKKCGSVIYSEMVGGEMVTMEMCRGCPVLKQRLEGKTLSKGVSKKEEELCCNNCHTSLETVLMGQPLGCKECYFIFQDILVEELMETQLISPRLRQNPASPIPTLHIGKTPFINESAKDATRIRDLNEALNDALKGENYEEAAWLRDQINSLTKASDDPS